MRRILAIAALFLVGCSVESNVSVTAPASVVVEHMASLPTDPTPVPFTEQDEARARTVRLNALEDRGPRARYDVGDKPAPDAATDLRQYDTPVKDQGQRGTCTAFATVGMIENEAKRKWGTDYDLSEQELWQLYQTPQMQPVVDAAKSHWLWFEADAPYDPVNGGPYMAMRWPWPRPRPTPEPQADDSKGHVHAGSITLLDNTVSAVIAAVSAGHPVLMGFDVSRAFMHPDKDGVISPYDRSVIGGHAIEIAGVIQTPKLRKLGGGYFILKNSWTDQWGDHGYGYMPFAYCEVHSCDSFYAVDPAALERR